MDWVTARHGCTAAQVFTGLRVGTEEDVALRNAQIKGSAYYSFRVYPSEGSFAVAIEWNRKTVIVRFLLRGETISIESDNGTVKLDAHVTMNDLGECRLLVDGVELEQWQVRKRALEALLFRTAD